MKKVCERRLGKPLVFRVPRTGIGVGFHLQTGGEAEAFGLGSPRPGSKVARASLNEGFTGGKMPQQGSFGKTTLPSLGVPNVSVAS
jgi:hypothetical protein